MCFAKLQLVYFLSQSKKEIFKKSFNGYKGAGGSFEQAGAKSYNAATKEICPLIYELLTE